MYTLGSIVVMVKGKDINKSKRGMLSIGKRVCLCSYVVFNSSSLLFFFLNEWNFFFNFFFFLINQRRVEEVKINSEQRGCTKLHYPPI